jgi:hypothetical protein
MSVAAASINFNYLQQLLDAMKHSPLKEGAMPRLSTITVMARLVSIVLSCVFLIA